MSGPELPEVELWSDGSCYPNPGPGGWCAILRFTDGNGTTHERELSGSEPETTNNRMELTAVLEGLVAVTRKARVIVFTDSMYVKDGIEKHYIERWKSNGWRTREKKPVKNRDLWSALDTARQVHDVCWMWVRGHNGNELNERCDEIAGRERKRLMGRRVVRFDPPEPQVDSCPELPVATSG